VKPDTLTVNQLFERDVRYIVPLYQRPYVWVEEDQWEPLWEDLLVLLRGEATYAGVASHFLGAIVLDQETLAPGRIPEYLVIDGQQRLTTLQLLVAAASREAAALGFGDDASILQDLTLNNPRKATGDDLLKVWPTNINRAAFRSVLQPEGGVVPDDPANLIQEAYAYFRGRVAAWIGDDDESGTAEERAERLRIVLTDLVKVVTITLETGDNAQVIFETLNARGTPLLALDLVKNAVFQEATKQGERVDQLYDEVWKPQLDDEYWRDERRQGRLKRARGELFLTYWLGMRLKSIVVATELFATFRKNVLQAKDREPIGQLIRTMAGDARTLRSFDSQPAQSKEALFFERLEALDVTTVMPLALLLFTSNMVDERSRRRALAMIESWLVRRMLLRLTTKNYTREISQLLDKIGRDPRNADTVVRDHLVAALGEGSRWPADAEVLTYLTTHDSYGNITGARIAMVLRAIEHSMYTSRIDLPTIPANLTIEHVMPQQWQPNWPVSPRPGSANEEAVNERNLRIHRLGNLTLASAGMNASLSNSPWLDKQGHLLLGTKLLMNGELIAEFRDRFDDAAIDRRTLQLGTRVCSIWPGPEANWAAD
jgi:hypothetical protein